MKSVSELRLSIAIQAVIALLLVGILVRPSQAPSVEQTDLSALHAQLAILQAQIGGEEHPGRVEGTTIRSEDLFVLLERICYALQNPDAPIPPSLGILTPAADCLESR